MHTRILAKQCLEQFIRFINRSTLIIAAITGKGYCASARKTGSLLLANVMRVAAVSIASRVVLLLGQLFVCAAATIGAWWWLTYDPFGTRQAQVSLGKNVPPVASLCVVALGSWLVGRAVMGVYWVVIDCVMMCFFYDSDKDRPLPTTNTILGRWRNKRIIIEEDEDWSDADAGGKRSV